MLNDFTRILSMSLLNSILGELSNRMSVEESQGRCSKFSLFSTSLVSGITIRTGSNNSVPGRISGVSINLGSYKFGVASSKFNYVFVFQ